ncbi:hypothetical protein LTR37_014435 [Vermiconidia calcicola]|uniref:Uncharacterized protein n=1 Tax=Vermiconidia calcicola TaxID=1690605 RepID=A0ACC3MV40_9PEZI|nr:hypothetical protein LTR37_014435 [Vermiconidia calcicola]
MLSSVARYADDSVGLEKALRLLQALCTTIIGLSVSSGAATTQWAQTRSELALGRRYFRLLKWHSCWSVAYQKFNEQQAPAGRLLEVGKWSFLGLYFFLEMPTITNAMGVTSYSWGRMLEDEALTCWFYGIAFSIALSLYQLFELSFGATAQKTVPKEKPATEEEKTAVSQSEKHSAVKKAEEDRKMASSKIYTQLTIDCCDLLIPGAAIGWVPAPEAIVGVAQSISSAIAIRQIWDGIRSTAV